MKILSRFDGRTCYEDDADSMLKTLQAGVKARADLTEADLTEANLTEADLTRADLTRANLTGADLTGAYLTGANLTGADLTGAYLTGAYLTGAYLTRAYLTRADLTRAHLTRAYLTEADLTEANLNWNSHWLIGHILKVAAGDDVARRCLAGGIIISADWCWDKMLSFDHPEKAWALSVLLPLIMVGDNAPEALRALKSKGETK
ncbi:pentapeptide repeat-containing protein [Candidatus Pacearchaeota archaeon]|jgi:hypothetical protein|nr:pentapeptide repeat-containing protein [Candidatus Pacearchaeota archaeon]